MVRIIENTGGFYTFEIDGDIVAYNSRNDVLVRPGGLCDFKTSEGANILKKQNIPLSDIVIVDVLGSESSVSSVDDLFLKLDEIKFFDWFRNTGEAASIDKFRELIDTFGYIGNNGKVGVVNESLMKLVPVTLYNYRKLTELEDVSISPITMTDIDKSVVVKSVGGTAKFVLVDSPDNNQLPDEIIFIGTITRDGNEFTIPANGQWRINGNEFTNSLPFTTEISEASEGYNRIDIIVARPDNTFEKIQGEESEFVAQRPFIPDDTILVTTFNISGSVVDNPEIEPSEIEALISQQENNSIILGNDGRLFSEFVDMYGLQLTSDQPASMIYLKDAEGNVIAELNVGFLNNEGSTFEYNPSTNTLDLINEAGDILASIPVESFVSNLATTISFNGSTAYTLELKDNTGTVISSVNIGISNVNGLTAALAGKANTTDLDLKVDKQTSLGPAGSIASPAFKDILKYGISTINAGIEGYNMSSDNQEFGLRFYASKPTDGSKVIVALMKGNGDTDFSGNLKAPLGKSYFTNTENYGIGTPDSDGLQVFSGDSIRFGKRNVGVSAFSEFGRFATDGKFGLGVNNPLVKLQIRDASNIFSFHVSGNDEENGIAMGTNSANDAVIQGFDRDFTNNNNIQLQPEGGNIGIGLSLASGLSPQEKLHVLGNVLASGFYAELDSSGSLPIQIIVRGKTDPNKSVYFGLNTTSNQGQLQAIHQTVGVMPLELNPLGGSVLINTDNNADPTKAMQVDGDVKFTGTLTVSDAVNPEEAVTFGQVIEMLPPDKKIYKVLLSQPGSGTPTITVIENTTGGTPVITRTGAGAFDLTLTGAWVTGKTYHSITSTAGTVRFIMYRQNSDVFKISIQDLASTSGVDGLLDNTPILIEIYP